MELDVKMSTPQLENGYTSTANELMEAECRASMTGNEWRVYNAVKRLTYGWNKKEDRIAYSQLAKLTGLGRNRVYEAVQSLIAQKILLSRQTGTHSPQILGINKDFNKWKLSRPSGISRQRGTDYPARPVQNYPATAGPPNKENNIKKKPSPKFPSEVMELARRLGRHIYKRNPKNSKLQESEREKTFLRWASDIDKLHRLDKQDYKDIEAVIDWCQADDFWCDNILSGKKLRDQFDTLYPKTVKETQILFKAPPTSKDKGFAPYAE